MKSNNEKNYFLLTCLIAVVIVILILAAKVMLFGSPGGMQSKHYNNSGAMGYDSSENYDLSVEGKRSASVANLSLAQDMSTSINPIIPPIPESAPVAGGERKIIKNGNVSIVVKNVDQSTRNIESKAKELGGYLSSTNLSSSGNTNKSGWISARIPADKVTDFISYLKASSVKVTNESINSDDVTSEFIDLEAKIKNSESTAEQYRELLKKTTKVEEILQVQRELNNLQSQIDAYKGQQKYLEANSALANITVNLAIDEGELPIQPENKWEPANVLKASIRSLTTFAQNLSYAAIAIAVYAVVWVPVGLILFVLYRILRKKIK